MEFLPTGIESKLDYLQKLGVGVISLNPIYATTGTMSTFRTESDAAITNHTSVNMVYGGMEDFESLVEAVHGKGNPYQLPERSTQQIMCYDVKGKSNADKIMILKLGFTGV